MSPPSSPEPEGASPRDLRRAERQAMNSESFPEFAEPTLASDSEIDQVVHLPPLRTSATAKPTMRVDASMLRGSGLLNTLPEFLGQLARANLETETKMANDPNAVRIELDDDQAASQQHVEMNLFSGLVEAQKRRQQRRILLPGDLAVKPPGTGENDSSEREGSVGEQSHHNESTEDKDSGDETDASTSTNASLNANLKKRKASDDEDSESASPPNKIRLQYQYPTPKLRHYDMKRRKLVSRRNPDAAPNDPFEALPDMSTSAADDKCITVAARPASSSSNHSSQTSSASVPITKIRVPSRSPDGSRSTSPDRIIHLRHPVMSSSREGSVSEDGSSSGRRPKIKVLQKDRQGAGRKKLIEEVE